MEQRDKESDKDREQAEGEKNCMSKGLMDEVGDDWRGRKHLFHHAVATPMLSFPSGSCYWCEQTLPPPLRALHTLHLRSNIHTNRPTHSHSHSINLPSLLRVSMEAPSRLIRVVCAYIGVRARMCLFFCFFYLQSSVSPICFPPAHGRHLL